VHHEVVRCFLDLIAEQAGFRRFQSSPMTPISSPNAPSAREPEEELDSQWRPGFPNTIGSLEGGSSQFQYLVCGFR
jgi:hypothetical protein